jgi:hypothetical protein
MAAWVCPDCEYRVNGGAHFDETREHVCDPRTVARVAAERLDESFGAFLASPAGRFEQHYARRREA